jgi:Flp pilus assembly protein TadG
MTIGSIALRLRAFLRRFADDREAVAAIEFALVLPFMLALYIGGVELGDGLAVQFKSTLAARTVADLASQYVSIDNATMSNILGAASSVVTPYSASGMVVAVSEVTTDSKGNGTITWSDALNGTAHKVGSSVTLPPNLRTPNISLIWGEVTYPYTPSMGYVITGTISIYESVYFYPRLSNSVTRVNS